MGKPPGTKNTKTRERLRCASEALRSDGLRPPSQAANGEARSQREGNDAMISPTITSDCLTSNFGNLMGVDTPGGPADLGFDIPGELEHLDQSPEDVICSDSTTAVADDLSSVSPSRSFGRTPSGTDECGCTVCFHLNLVHTSRLHHLRQDQPLRHLEVSF
jgi:hypothetical protein